MADNWEQKELSDELKEAWTEAAIELLSKHESLSRDDLIGAACDLSNTSYATGERYFKVRSNSITGIFSVSPERGKPVRLNDRYFNTLKPKKKTTRIPKPKKKAKHPTLRRNS